MAKSEREQLSRALNDHLNTIHETFQVLDQTPASSLEKVGWKEVIQMGEQVSKQATAVGMLYTGETPGVKALEENMAAYFNMLQGLLLLSHGSSVGAGPTLASCIHKAVKQVVDGSFMLLQEAVSSYVSPRESQKHSIPPLVGVVWDACSSLKKTPSTNVTAIGRAMTQIAVSIKDVLRELNDLKPADDEPSSSEFPTKDESSDGSCDDGDLGNDLSPEEMKIARSTISIVFETFVVIKELIRSVTGLFRKGNDDAALPVDLLERLLKICQGIGVQVDELGACLYPPQEVSAIKAALEKISGYGREMETELRNVGGFTDEFGKAYGGLRGSLRRLEREVGCGNAGGLVLEMENLVVRN